MFSKYLFMFFTFLVFGDIASAWLPGVEKDIIAHDGTNLFQNQIQQSTLAERFLPSWPKIRGVNLGSLFVYEPWMASGLWKVMCGNTQSEYECTRSIGQQAANAQFQNHWSTFIVKQDFVNMTNVGLNTVRIPVGFWMVEELVYANESFPQGGMAYLEQACEWAAEAGMYVILDLHGAPGAQVANNSFTGYGTIAKQPGFYKNYQYNRALSFLANITAEIHSKKAYRNVGMLELVNEPERSSLASTMISSYYPNAFNTIRAVEKSLGLNSSSQLTIQMMNKNWGSGDPNAYLNSTELASGLVAYDDHRYTKYDTSVPVTHSAYIASGCNDTSALGNTPTIVGEFSLSPPDNVQGTPEWSTSNSSNIQFYRDWFAAQVFGYEKNGIGWCFWSWKTQGLNDYRWDYQMAVAAGVIPTNLDQALNSGVCQ